MKITSEEPEIHWPFLNVKDKVVLDLGCGLFYSKTSTPDWFVQQGAKQVIGVDLGNDTPKHFIYHQIAISSKNDILDLLNKYTPDVIKCDIEGAEKHFKDVSANNMESVKQFAVEYHDNDLKLLMEQKIKDWGFEGTEIYQLFNEDINRIGVIYAYKL
jgi:hypothetical protein